MASGFRLESSQEFGIKTTIIPLAAMLICASAVGQVAHADHADGGRFGVATEVGVPDGVMVAGAYHAHPLLTTHVGLGYNLNSPGLRIGATFAPLSGSVTPLATLELGHYFAADTPEWMRETAKDAGLNDKTLIRLGYTFINTHLGLRVGSPRIGVRLHGGLSFVAAKALVIKPKPNFTPPVELYRETSVRVWTLSGKLGMEYNF